MPLATPPSTPLPSSSPSLSLLVSLFYLKTYFTECFAPKATKAYQGSLHQMRLQWRKYVKYKRTNENYNIENQKKKGGYSEK